jgi:two-component system, chemotaxis family, chemotaxis protein CheY
MEEKKIRLLLIDDSDFAHQAVKEVIKDQNMELVAEAVDGPSGLDMYKKTKPDVVLLDIVMPGVHGDKILEEILEFDQKARVIMVSSLATENKILGCLRKGAKNFVPKPFEGKDLVNAIEEVTKGGSVQYSVVSILKDMNIGTRFFGQYLVAKGVINSQQLEKAIKFQKTKNLTLETICLNKKLLTKEQVKEIREVQRKAPDKSFGEVTIEKGFLTQDKLEELIKEQRKNQVFLGEALINTGALSFNAVTAELQNYKDEQSKIEGEIIYNLYNLEDKAAVKVFVSFTVNAIKLFEDLLGIPVKINGCVPLSEGFDLFREYLIEQKAKGTVDTSFLFNFSKEISQAITSVLLNKDVKKVGKIEEDALKEFLNIVSGNCCAKLANVGVEIEMTSPEFWAQGSYPTGGKFTYISLMSEKGDFEVMMRLDKA